MTAGVYGLPGGQGNSYLPALADNLFTSFSRNAKEFAVNMLVKTRTVKKPQGQYLYFNPLDYQRFQGGSSAPGDQFKWGDNTLRPIQGGPQLGYVFNPYNCIRRSYARSLSLLTDQVADFAYLKNETEDLAAQAMAERSIEVVTAITTSGNYPASHVATATALSGGFLTAGTETNPAIKNALSQVHRTINLDSNGAAKRKDLVVVMNPNTAYRLSITQEVHTLFVRSQTNVNLLTKANGVASNAEDFGLPPTLYDFRVVVMDTTDNTNPRATSGEARTYIFPDNQIAVVCVRGGPGDAAENGTAIDTCHLFLYEDMSVESETVQWDRIIKIAVTDHRQAVMVAPVTGFLITNVYV